MKLFVASAALDSIRWAFESRLADGVFVTPSSLDADAYGIEPAAQVESILRIASVPLLVTVGAVAANDLHKHARALARISEHVVVTLPFVEDGITAMTKLAAEGIRVAATFIVTPAQALLAAKIGAAHVCVSLDALEMHGHEPTSVLRESRALFDRHGVEADLVAIAGAGSRRVTDAFGAGADAVVVTPETLRGLIQHPFTDRALDHMLGAVSRRPRGRNR